jgi:serine protease Do
MRLRFAIGFLLVLVPFGALAALPLPTLPGATGADASQTQPAPVASVHAATTDKVRKGVVTVETGGRIIALGTVLGLDGRVLTSLTGLGGASEADVRFSDNHVIHARIGHKDAQSDLALLVPQSGKWPDGLAASENDPAWVDLRAIGVNQGKLAVVSAKVKGRIEAKAKDGSALANVLDLDLGAGGATPGAPLIDGGGAVAGIIVRACKPAPSVSAEKKPADTTCTPIWIGAPIHTLRKFLM